MLLILSICLIFFLFVLTEDRVNFLIGILSLSLVYFAVKSILAKQVTSHNVFLLFFFGSMFTSTWALSSFQTSKSIEDVYFYFFGPLCFALVLYLFERKKNINLRKIKPFVNVHLIYLAFLFAFICIKLYIGFTVGWRINSLSDSTYLESGSEYVIPGISGIAAILQWQLLIFAPYVKKKYVICAIIAIVILTGILHVKRGDVLRLMMFLFIWFLNNQLKGKAFSVGKKVKALVIVVIGFLLFVESGNFRQDARGGSENDLKSNIGMKDAPISLAWFYGYVSINYEVVRYYFNSKPSNSPNSILSLLSSDDDGKPPEDTHSINGFNASTFISGFVKDYNYLYFLEMIAFGIIIGIILIVIKSQGFLGGYLFILSLLAFSFFGNYLSNRSIFLSILLSICIYPILNKKQENA